MEAQVRQQYDRLANIYDHRWQFYINRTLSFLLEWAQIQPAEKVLDVACGTGELERLLTLQNPPQSITGVDFSEAMLAIARQKCAVSPQVRFCAAAAAALPWSQPLFDAILCANAFHYFDAPEHVLAEMRRVLQPQGRLLILDWCRDFWVCRVCDWVLGWLDPAHQRCYTEAELHALLSVAGFRVKRSQRVRFGLIWGLMAVEAIAAPPLD